jgi:hypothetical protein
VTGQSKGTLREGFRYLQLLGEMRWSLGGAYLSRLDRPAKLEHT